MTPKPASDWRRAVHFARTGGVLRQSFRITWVVSTMLARRGGHPTDKRVTAWLGRPEAV